MKQLLFALTALLAAAPALAQPADQTNIDEVRTGEDLSIRELAEMIREVVYPDAKLTFDTTKPDGTPRKLLDVSKLHALGWRHRIPLREGIESTYRWFLEHSDDVRRERQEVRRTAVA